MKFIKEHKYTFIIAGVFIVLFIFAFIGLKNLLYPDSGKDKYGDRLDGIEEHPIKNEDIESVKSKVKESKKVNDITYSLEGRLMKFAIDVKKGTDKEIPTLLYERMKRIKENPWFLYSTHASLTSAMEKAQNLVDLIGKNNVMIGKVVPLDQYIDIV